MSWLPGNRKDIAELKTELSELQKGFSDYKSSVESVTVELIGKDTGETSAIDERTKLKRKIREFMKLYENDSLTFALVNFIVQRIVPTYNFVGDDKAVKKLNDWADRVYFKRVLEDLVLDMVLGGTAWTEPVWDSVEINKFKILNPDKMDFIRDSNNDVMYDDENKPTGYIQDKNGTLRYWYADRIEENGKPIFNAPAGTDLRDKIKYFKLRSYGDSELGISLIQPNYRSAIIRSNIEDMIGESAFRGGGIVAYIDGELPPDVKKNLKIDLQNITSKNIFLLSKKIQLSVVPIPELTSRELLVYSFADMQCGGMGVPIEMILAGHRTSNTAIPDKTSDLEIRVASYQERLAEQVNILIIDTLLEKWHLANKGKIVFPPASPANQLNRSRVISSLARRNLMTYDPEMEMYIRKELKLPTDLLSKVLDEWKKNPPVMSATPTIGQDVNVQQQQGGGQQAGGEQNNPMQANQKHKPVQKSYPSQGEQPNQQQHTPTQTSVSRKTQALPSGSS
jgi:hypothetical protein